MWRLLVKTNPPLSLSNSSLMWKTLGGRCRDIRVSRLVTRTEAPALVFKSPNVSVSTCLHIQQMLLQ